MTEHPEAHGTYFYPTFPIGEGKTDYERYLRTSTLLALQTAPDKAASPQELLFQVTHQSSELWMKLMLDEFGIVQTALLKPDVKPDLWTAARSMRLINDTLKLLIQHVDLIAQHISIVEYHKIRTALGQGSGMESPGFNRLLLLAPEVWASFQKALSAQSLELYQIYANYTTHMDWHTLAELFVDYDDLFHKWRSHHMDLVARTIGVDANSLKGLSTQVLQKGIKHHFFPELFAVRARLTNESGLAYGGNPLAH